jgi:4-alpha-glucanotransferase
MKILSVQKEENYSSAVKFKRKLKPVEKKYYTSAIKEGLQILDKELGFIIHNSSAPSGQKFNTGIGSLLKKHSENLFIPFLASQGFSSIQQEPIYIRRKTDTSPYNPLSTSKNIYMIPLEKLSTEEYVFILKQKDLKLLQSKNDEKVNYKSIQKNYNKVLYKAYRNFCNLNYNNSKQEKLAKEFTTFKSERKNELEQNSMYEILSDIYNEENWRNWSEEDKYLYDNPINENRKRHLIEQNKERIDFFAFKQWLIEREIAQTNKENEQLGIKIIADTPIAFTPAEEWLNKDLFLQDFVLGCPPDYFSRNGQRWDFAIINPETLFNSDGSLGKGGEFLKSRYEAIFQSSPGGVRIDHLIGLIDPFVYKKDEPQMTEHNSGRLYSTPSNPLLKKFTKYTDSDYTAVFEKIIFPAAEKFGIKKCDIICEDLGAQTLPVKKAIERLGLTGLSVTQFGYSGADAPKRNVIMLGSHDNQSYIEYTDGLFANASNLGEGRDRFIYKTHILGSDTVTPGNDVNLYREQLRSNKKKFLTASFAELFTSPAKKIQIFFTDFFGIGKTYNIPGTKKDCWTLRLNSSYDDLYHQNLKEETAINLPEAIAIAIRQKGEAFSSRYTNLLRKLDYFTKVLKY